ncbi:Guanine nucleotide exchange factor VAV3 [Acipenser ruthenus]|uniref:Guanine nucleotide exchange factor VAV3 n=1 Tax=Acipenser ruthenus TaxID=7906 RepID=A0A444U9L9_ACIRT|nr:Guanine nucleotide exchange factor VAV3 [Acipenser ruthenus]
MLPKKSVYIALKNGKFLCLKNIRTFLSACCEIFGMRKSELFEAFDLFDVRDFAKVIETLSRLSHTVIAQHTGISENEVEDEEDLYDCVYGEDEGGEKQAETDIRSCCLQEIKQTEEKYTETLESIERYFMTPLRKFVSATEIEKVFVNVPELVKVHKSLMQEIHDSISNKNSQNLYQIFINYKERLLIYGKYCSHVETAIAGLDDICKEKEDVRLKLEECSKRANNGKFTLRDLLVVPMQRVLKYHLLLQELVKHTHDQTDKSNLRMALDAMKDLAQYVNEVKRDNETLREIYQFQLSIENLNQSLRNYGRPKVDGEVRVASLDKRAKQDRHIFLFDKAVIVCKRRGDNYEMKEVIDLHNFKITNNPTTDKENKKWSYGFYLTHIQGQNGFEFFFKTKELKKKWLEQFGMAIGIFYQGYLCSKCGAGAHKECLGRLETCGKTHTGLPKMQVIRNYLGIPPPLEGPPLNIQVGEIIEVIRADVHSSWWQGRILTTKEVGFFPSDVVKPYCVPKPVDYSAQPWFAGPMERLQAEMELINRGNSTYLVRHRSKECTEYAVSIKYNNDVKHIKILTKDVLFYIAENKKFKSLLELIEYYKHHSLKEGFRSLDTTLQFPYKEPENAVVHRGNRTGSNLFTPKVIGIAIARYDFSPRDMRELSLLEGDMVKIYTKTGANGWWRGEANGKVGWFPSTYVEEEEE